MSPMPLVSTVKGQFASVGGKHGPVVIGGFGQHRLALLAGCVVPDQLRPAAGRAVLVEQFAVGRSRQDTSPCVRIDGDVVGKGLGFTLQRAAAQVETLRHQRVVAHKQKISRGRVDGVGIISQQQLALFGIERSHVDAAVCARRAVGEVEKVVAVRKKIGPAMGSLLGVEAWSVATRVPPAASTRARPDVVSGAKTIVPVLPQVPPRPAGASQRACGGPPLASNLFSLPAAKNAT